MVCPVLARERFVCIKQEQQGRAVSVNRLTGLKNQPKIIVVNTAVPRPWASENDLILNEVIPEYPNAILVDWAALSAGHPEYFAPDGVHLVDAGSDIYVAAILEHLPKSL